MSKRIALIACLVGFVAAPSAFAATTWTLTSGNNNGATYGNSRTFSADGIDVTATAWANTGAGGTIQNAYLPVYDPSGLGVINRSEGNFSSPGHSMDNQSGYDSILLSFTDVIALSSLRLGWISGDSDITVLAYTGAGAPTLAGSTYGSLSGWDLIGHYANVGYGDAAINAANVTSSYWLISAYNPLVGGGGGAGLGTGNDFVKLAMVSGSRPPPPPPNGVPEPGTLALAGLAMVGLVGMRRRKS